eukprot:scaffold751_cov395-Prasinococcus_capsulatus_cf.AAC.21
MGPCSHPPVCLPGLPPPPCAHPSRQAGAGAGAGLQQELRAAGAEERWGGGGDDEQSVSERVRAGHLPTYLRRPRPAGRGARTRMPPTAAQSNRMDGWMDGRTDGRMDGWMEEGAGGRRGGVSLSKCTLRWRQHRADPSLLGRARQVVACSPRSWVILDAPPVATGLARTQLRGRAAGALVAEQLGGAVQGVGYSRQCTSLAHPSSAHCGKPVMQRIGKAVRRDAPVSKAKVYADVNLQRPKEYWDYESLTVQWG